MDILSSILGLLISLSLPIFLIGVYKFYKEKKSKQENIKILTFLSKIILAFFFTVFFVYIYLFSLMFIVYSFINFVFNTIDFMKINGADTIVLILVASFYILGIYGFAKWLLEILKLNFFIIFSILLFNISMLVYSLTTVVNYGPPI